MRFNYYYYYYGGGYKETPDSGILEVHYRFSDDSHTMDAFVQNKCQLDLLNIVKHVSKIMNVDVVVEISPVENGGLKEWFRVFVRDAGEKDTLARAVVQAVIIAIILGVGAESYKKITEDTEKTQWERDMLRRTNNIQIIDSAQKSLDLEESIARLANTQNENDEQIEHHSPIKHTLRSNYTRLTDSEIVSKKRDTFLKRILRYKKIDSISLIAIDGFGNVISEERIIKREYIEALYGNQRHSAKSDDATAEMLEETRKWFEREMPLRHEVQTAKHIEPSKTNEEKTP
jgi:hypothetical protein